MNSWRMSDRLALVFLSAFLLLVAALSAAPLLPPAPPAGQGPAAFSVTRAFAHVERIAREPHPMGSPASQRVRKDITAQLRQLGLDPQVQTVAAPDYFGGSSRMLELGNIMARIPGSSPASASAVALVAHYDTVPATPGANDNTSGVAIILETARAILAGPRPRNDIILLFTDGEEPAPRFGSSAFVSQHPWARDIGFVINLEALGSGGPSLLIDRSGLGGWAVGRYIEAAPYPVAFSFLTTTAALIGGSNTDFATFRDQDIPGVEFAYLRGSPIYHTPADNLQRVGLRSLYQQGANTLAVTRHVAGLASVPSGGDSPSTFFNAGPFGVVSYPLTWALPLALLAGAILAVAAWRQRAWRRTLRSAGATVVVLLAAALSAAVLWTALAGWRSMMSVAESYLYLAALLALAAAITLAVSQLARRQTSAAADALGVLLVWWALALLTAFFAPGMSYLFVWPALAGGLILLLRTWLVPAPRWQPVFSLLVVAIALVLLTPAVDIFYHLAQPRPGNLDSQILPVVAIPVALLALGLDLFRGLWVRPGLRLPFYGKPARTVDERRLSGA